MVREEVKNTSRLERKPHVPQKDRTPERDRIADWIEDKAADDWDQWTMSSVAQAADCSRQHVGNVLEHYFIAEGESRGIGELGEIGSMDSDEIRHLLGEATEREFLILSAGYRQGYKDGREDEASTE